MKKNRDRLRPKRGGALYFSRPLLLAASALFALGVANHSTVLMWVGGALLASSTFVAAVVGFAEARRRERDMRARCG